MRFDIDKYIDSEGNYEILPNIEKIFRSKRAARSTTLKRRSHIVKESYPYWARSSFIDTVSVINLTGILKIDPYIKEVANEQRLQIMEQISEIDGHY